MEDKKKKNNFINKAISWFQNLFGNKIVVAIMLLFQGVTFILNPTKAMTDMVKGLAMTAAIAALVCAAQSIFSKNKSAAVWRTLAVSMVILAVSVYSWLKPDILSFYMKYIIAGIAIYTGLSNIFSDFKLEKMSNATEMLASQTRQKIETISDTLEEKLSAEETKQMETSIGNSVKEHVEKRFTPASTVAKRFTGSKVLSVIIHIIMVVMGIMLIFFTFETNVVMMITSGITMILTALSDLWTAWKCRKALRKIKNGDA